MELSKQDRNREEELESRMNLDDLKKPQTLSKTLKSQRIFMKSV